jgi:transcriptional regulator with XRE-family HTH domain
MRIAHYLHIDKRLKSFRTGADMSQKEMASKLGLSVPTYSNYENGYSEPPVEVIQKFCSIIGIDEDLFFGFTVTRENDVLTISTYSDILKVIMELKNSGIPVTCSTTVNTKTRRLVANINVESPQIASLISRWNELNSDLENKKIDTEEYNIWIDSLMNSFNIPIENY